MLTVNGRKMSKSEGNGFTPDELITGNHKLLEKGYSPMTVRFFMLQGHYAGTLDFSNPALQAAEKGLERLMSAWRLLEDLKPVSTENAAEAAPDVDAILARAYAAMNDDFNTPILIAVLYDAVKVSVTDLKMRLAKLLNTNQVYDLSVDNIKVYRERGVIVIDARYEKRFPLFWILDGVMNFDDLVVETTQADRT